MQIHFPEMKRLFNDASESDNIISVYIGQTIPEAEMLKRLILNGKASKYRLHPRPL